ncbi:hypothetical protein H6A68_08655, partial [Bifidobacterium pullorum subsp. saeculare]|uniref:hypothetical protein n=1 Tax=Bifidobacterium pullorum TaxID=78448 RepID=UPI001959F606
MLGEERTTQLPANTDIGTQAAAAVGNNQKLAPLMLANEKLPAGQHQEIQAAIRMAQKYGLGVAITNFQLERSLNSSGQ